MKKVNIVLHENKYILFVISILIVIIGASFYQYYDENYGYSKQYYKLKTECKKEENKTEESKTEEQSGEKTGEGITIRLMTRMSGSDRFN